MLMINGLKGILKLGNSTFNNRILLSMAVPDLRMKLVQSLLKIWKKWKKDLNFTVKCSMKPFIIKIIRKRWFEIMKKETKHKL